MNRAKEVRSMSFCKVTLLMPVSYRSWWDTNVVPSQFPVLENTVGPKCCAVPLTLMGLQGLSQGNVWLLLEKLKRLGLIQLSIQKFEYPSVPLWSGSWAWNLMRTMVTIFLRFSWVWSGWKYHENNFYLLLILVDWNYSTELVCNLNKALGWILFYWTWFAHPKSSMLHINLQGYILISVI